MEDNRIESNTGEITLKEIYFTIKEWFQYLLSNYKLIVLVGIVGALLGLGYSYTKKPKYTAVLSFALEDDKPSGLGGALGLAGQFGLDVGGGGGGVFSGSNLIELFKSRSMVEKTLLTPILQNGKTISLAEMYIQNNKWRKGWAKDEKLKSIQFLPNAKRETFTRAQDSILEIIYNSLSASGLSVLQKDKKISIITVEVKSENEVFSKVFNEALADVVSDFYIDSKSEKSRLNMTILQRQLDSIRGELNGSITGVAVANDRTFNLNPALNVKRVPSARKQVDVQANTAILTELVKQTELAKVTLRKDTPLIQIIDKPIYPLKKEKFGKAKGIIMGGFLGGFFIVAFLILKRLWKMLLN
ncbi:Wzz/FepE/Etk N-terminal domain-containing protein [Flavobacterium cerinum]|uniref:Lipopolysaccharide biosynthesis protein n=1 Tax=Flavobacterium cerinum TaxID=2502784 RepID=A0A3S3QM95_9FLAO|nr:Wzz/FepE/Etk N-terminal domain-containing protein [Flavobacterium cerinum]RWX02374.1 lipopolysaccharide biosynthesis protein [Flavobacterium cerinum]